MKLEWLYGPITAVDGFGDSLAFVSTVIDTDDILEAANKLMRATPEAGGFIVALWNPRTGEEVPLAEPEMIHNLSNPDKRHIVASVISTTNQVLFKINLITGMRPTISTNARWQDVQGIIRDATRTFTVGKRRRPRWGYLARFAPAVLFVALLASLTVWMSTTGTPGAEKVFASLLTFAVGVGSYFWSRSIGRRYESRWPGVLVIEQRRAVTAANRADRKRDFRVAGLTFLGTVAAAALLYFLGLRD